MGLDEFDYDLIQKLMEQQRLTNYLLAWIIFQNGKDSAGRLRGMNANGIIRIAKERLDD